MFKNKRKANHLLYMDNLKLFDQSKRDIEEYWEAVQNRQVYYLCAQYGKVGWPEQ